MGHDADTTAESYRRQRIDSGEFGYCAVCEEEIDLRRLKIDPTTTRCLECM